MMKKKIHRGTGERIPSPELQKVKYYFGIAKDAPPFERDKTVRTFSD